MKILVLCADPGIRIDGVKGAAAHLRGLVRAFRRDGHAVQVVGHGNPGATLEGAVFNPVPVSSLVENGHKVTEKRVGRALRHVWTNAAVEKLVELIAVTEEPDVVYERYSPFGIAGGLVARRFGLPHILEVNAPLAWEGRRYRTQALPDAAEALEATAFANATRIVAVSDVLRDTLVASGVDAGKIDVVPNGVDDALFPFEAPPAPGGCERPLMIGFVGSLKPWHGLDVLAEAFRRVSSDARFHLKVVGTGPEARVIQKLQRDFPGRVTLTGGVAHHEVASSLRDVDIAVAPYPQIEPFYFSPLKILEYMALGKTVVASRIGQIPDFIESGRTGILVPPGDAESLSVELIRLADAPDERRTIGAAAALEVHDRHLWIHRVDDILKTLGVPA